MRLHNFLTLHKVIWMWLKFTSYLFTKQIFSKRKVIVAGARVHWVFEGIVPEGSSPATLYSYKEMRTLPKEEE